MPKEFAQTDWNDPLVEDARQLIHLACREDLNQQCDWTTVSLVDPDAKGAASIVSRQNGVAAGLRIIPLIIDELSCSLNYELNAEDGEAVRPGQRLATIEGSARDLLTNERILLNFLGRMCGIATLVSSYVEAIHGTDARVYDTRKTTPGWRRLEKFAVRCGGGTNHRLSLDSAVMVKDNHLAFCRDEGPSFHIADSIGRVRNFLANADPALNEMIIEVEVDSLEQLKRVLPAAPDIVLLDNMSIQELTEAVALRNENSPHVQLEASGGITLQSIREVAMTGVDRISSGALTHSAVNLDVGLDWR